MFTLVYTDLTLMSNNNNKHKVSCKVWLEFRGEPLLGKGGAEILETIKQVESISKAAKKTGMSYRYVWNYLAKLERRLGEPVITTFKGGSKGGGGAKLTNLGAKLIKEYQRAEFYMTETIGKKALANNIKSKHYSRNLLKGTVQEVYKEATNATVVINLETPVNLTAIMPKDVVENLSLKTGDKIEAIIKSTEIKIPKKTDKR